MSFAKAKRFSYSQEPQQFLTPNKLQTPTRQSTTKIDSRRVSLPPTPSSVKKTPVRKFESVTPRKPSTTNHRRQSISDSKRESMDQLSLMEPQVMCEPSFQEILQRKLFIEENRDEITFYFPYTETDSSSGVSSRDSFPIADNAEELKEIQTCCAKLQAIFKGETDAASFNRCCERVQKLLNYTETKITRMIDAAKSDVRSNRCKVNNAKTNNDVIATLVLEEMESKTKHYLDRLGVSISRTLRQTKPSGHKTVNKIQQLIDKLLREQSEPKCQNLLEAAQRKIIEQELLIEYLRAELNRTDNHNYTFVVKD